MHLYPHHYTRSTITECTGIVLNSTGTVLLIDREHRIYHRKHPGNALRISDAYTRSRRVIQPKLLGSRVLPYLPKFLSILGGSTMEDPKEWAFAATRCITLGISRRKLQFRNTC